VVSALPQHGFDLGSLIGGVLGGLVYDQGIRRFLDE